MNRLPIFAFLGCSVIWGSTYLVIRIGNGALAPVWACCLRLLLASLILHAVMVIGKIKYPTGDGLKAAIWFGVLEFGISMALLYFAESKIPSGLAALMFATCPITAMIGGSLLGTEKFSPRLLGISLIALIGVAIVFWRELVAGVSPLGMAIALLAAIGGALAGNMLQRGPKQSPIAVNAIASLVGGVMALAGSFVIGENRVIPSTLPQIFPVVYLAVLGSGCAFVMFAWLLNHWPTSRAAFVGVSTPVIAVLLGALVLHEGLTPGALVGGLIVVASVVLALRGPSKSIQHSIPEPAIE